MTKHPLVLGALYLAFDASAQCVIDTPEMGDIGPSSERVCSALEQRFPTATLAVENRIPDSPEAVSVLVRINGQRTALRYELSRGTWSLSGLSGGISDQGLGEDGLSMR
jgi:hypothetical protein